MELESDGDTISIWCTRNGDELARDDIIRGGSEKLSAIQRKFASQTNNVRWGGLRLAKR